MLLTNIKNADTMAQQEVDSLCQPDNFEEYHGTPLNEKTADTAIDSQASPDVKLAPKSALPVLDGEDEVNFKIALAPVPDNNTK